MLSGVPIATSLAAQMSRGFAGESGVNPFAVARAKKVIPGEEDKLDFQLRAEEDAEGAQTEVQQAHLKEMLTARLLSARLPDEASPGEMVIQINWITGDIVIYRKDAVNDIGFAFCADGSVVRHYPSQVVARTAVLPEGTFDFEWVQAVYTAKKQHQELPCISSA